MKMPFRKTKPTPEQVAWNNRMQKVARVCHTLNEDQLEGLLDWLNDKIEYFVQFPDVQYFFETGITTQGYATIVIPLYEEYFETLGIEMENV